MSTTASPLLMVPILLLAQASGLSQQAENEGLRSEIAQTCRNHAGFKDVPSDVEITVGRLGDTNLPFLKSLLPDEPIVNVRLDVGRIELPSAKVQDQYHRHFVVTLSSDGKRVYNLLSVPDDKDAPVDVPSAEHAQSQIAAHGEEYRGIPKDAPKITFVEALNVVLSRGIGSPMFAKGIEGTYVMYSRGKETPRAVWVINLYGMPPIPAKRSDTPEWQRNHMRNIVDATTGKGILATTVPHPK